MPLPETLRRIPHPPVAWLFKPLHVIPWSLRNRPLAQALNHTFREPLSDGDFDCLEDHWLQLSVTDVELDFYLTVIDEKLVLGSPRPCDVTIRGKSSAFLALASRREDPDTLFFQRRLVIEGNTELGLAIKNMLDGIDLDQLPQLVKQLLQTSDRLVSLAS